MTERGDDGVVRIKDLTKGIGVDSVLECVGTQESMMQAISCTRPGGANKKVCGFFLNFPPVTLGQCRKP